MKKIYKIIISLSILLGLGIIVAYASGVTGQVKWIYDTSTDSRFEDHSNDTTYGTGYYLDTWTGLKWQANSGPSKYWAKGCESNNDNNKACSEYKEPVWNTDHYIYTDKYPSGGQESDFEAHKYCESLGGGNKGWRLPTKRELFSIMTDTSGERNSHDKYTKLPSVSTDCYWSSTVYANYTHNAWYGYFYNGHMDSNHKKFNNYTICIHD